MAVITAKFIPFAIYFLLFFITVFPATSIIIGKIISNVKSKFIKEELDNEEVAKDKIVLIIKKPTYPIIKSATLVDVLMSFSMIFYF